VEQKLLGSDSSNLAMRTGAPPAVSAFLESGPDRVVFDSGLVRVGAFRCEVGNASFHDSGPARNYCFVFPRTAVEIQHEHERAFAANPNVVTFYNQGQTYVRNPISSEGDRCDWFGVRADIAREVVRGFDTGVDSRPEWPFRFTRGWADAETYLCQRQVFERVIRGGPIEPLAIEEAILVLLERVLESAYRTAGRGQRHGIGAKQRDIVHHIELVLSARWGERLTLQDVAGEVGLSAYHLCRLFRRATGMTLHGYRQRLHLRGSLEGVMHAERSLVDIALDAGFCSHSHFTNTFCKEFGLAPSKVRTRTGRSGRKSGAMV
jgi:AraC-like DNA-binding protein